HPAHRTVAQVPRDGVDDFLTTAVAHADVDQHARVSLRRLLGVAERLERTGAEQVQLPDRANAYAEPSCEPSSNPLGKRLLDDGQDRRHVLAVPGQVLGREPPERHGGDVEFSAPAEHLLGFARAEVVAIDVRDARRLSVPTVAVLDEAEVARGRTSNDL